MLRIRSACFFDGSNPHCTPEEEHQMFVVFLFLFSVMYKRVLA